MNLLVLGGSSDIGLAVAEELARRHGARVTLASRNLQRLERLARDIELRHQVTAEALYFDARDFAAHEQFYRNLPAAPDVVLAAFGVMHEQQQAQQDFTLAREMIETNFTGLASILELVAADFESKGRGVIIGIASVAGLRGRRSNYLYGASKAGCIAYLAGLRHRLHGAGVQVLTVLPGFVHTRMTEGLDLPPSLTATPQQVASEVVRAMNKGQSVIYCKAVWRYIMWLIRLMPERLFVRTGL